METILDPQKPENGALDILQTEYETAMQSREPVSRRRLALLVSTKTGMPYKDAFAVVDAFCDEKSLPVPGYLSKEFSIYWLKAVAVFEVFLAILVMWYGRTRHLAHEYPWLPYMLGTILCGLAVLAWVKSLQREVLDKVN